MRGRIGETSGDRMISMSITMRKGEVEHPWVRGKANREKRGFRVPGEPFGR